MQAHKPFQKHTISLTSWPPPLPVGFFFLVVILSDFFSLFPTIYSLTMGQGESTPLSLMTDHFSDVRTRAHNLSLIVKKSKLITFCSAEWPAFQVGWPPEGTFQPSIIQTVKGKIMAPDPWGHPGQVPYVMVWQDLVENPPKWLKPFVHKLPSSSNSQVLVMETPPEETKKKEDPKPVLQESSYPNLMDLETEIRPPPYAPPCNSLRGEKLLQVNQED